LAHASAQKEKMLRAVMCREFGLPDKLSVEEVPDPEPEKGEVLIETRAAALSFPDVLIIQDAYQFKQSTPFTPGSEVAGVVKAVGPGVEGYAVGDRVCGGTASGGFAELAVLKTAQARSLPSGLGFGEATGLLYAYGTGIYGLRERGNLQAGETVLILGAGGTLGIAAIELAKNMGARVIAAASTAEKLALCRECGADEVIDYSKESLKERTKELTGGAGADVVYDSVGGDYAEAALRATAWGGRFLVIGFTAGIPQVPLNLALLKGCQIVGVFLGAMMGREPQLAAELMAEIDGLCAAGKLSGRVGARYPLAGAPRAMQDMLDRKSVGKVVIEP
jgi:NADPH2:quinone reductase